MFYLYALLAMRRLDFVHRVLLVSAGKEMEAAVSNGRLEFNAKVRLHSIREIN